MHVMLHANVIAACMYNKMACVAACDVACQCDCSNNSLGVRLTISNRGPPTVNMPVPKPTAARAMKAMKNMKNMKATEAKKKKGRWVSFDGANHAPLSISHE